MSNRLALAVTMLAVAMAGCGGAPLYNVDVSGLASEAATTKRRYVLLPANADVSADDLQFKEYSQYVHRALAKRGFQHAQGFNDADAAIFLAYGMGQPKERSYSYSLPVFGQTGVSSSTTTGSVTNYGGYGRFSANTTHTPTYGVTGYQTASGSYTEHSRHVIIDAYDLDAYRHNGKMVQLWQTQVRSVGSSDDLRRVFPPMIAAAGESFGASTGKVLEVSIRETDERVSALKAQTSDGTGAAVAR